MKSTRASLVENLRFSFTRKFTTILLERGVGTLKSSRSANALRLRLHPRIPQDRRRSHTSYTVIQASHVSTGTTNNALVINPSGGNVGVGTTTPYKALHVTGSSAGDVAALVANTNAAVASSASLGFGLWSASGSGTGTSGPAAQISAVCRDAGGGNTDMTFNTYTGNGVAPNFTLVERMRITATGNVGIGTTNPTSILTVSTTNATDTIRFFNTFGGSTGSIALAVATTAGSFIINGTANAGVILADQDLFLNRDSSLNCAMVIKSGTGNVGIGTSNPTSKLQVNGSLAKSSGTFDIGHPLYPDTNKRLVHSFIEGPRCDLIYRGKTTLVNGTAVVNIDKECTHSPECAMDEGTFEALCDNPQIFLQNNQSFDRVRGVIAGATLTITCETPAAVEIEWMVIAERADPFIKQWDRTNPDGYLITQYDAPAAPPPSSGAEAAPPPPSGA